MVKIISCNNAGENKSLQQDSFKKGLGLTFQFSPPYTPQHNGSIKQSFATSYRRMRAILNSNKIKGHFQQSLWAETANFNNDVDNIMVNRDNKSCPYKRFAARCRHILIIFKRLDKLALLKTEIQLAAN